MELFLCVIGMVMIVEGLPYFGFPDKMKEFMTFMLEQDDRLLRIVGGVMIAAGLLTVYFARGAL
jgi:uncharacterized protein